jgi:hypothetical protein
VTLAKGGEEAPMKPHPLTGFCCSPRTLTNAADNIGATSVQDRPGFHSAALSSRRRLFSISAARSRVRGSSFRPFSRFIAACSG